MSPKRASWPRVNKNKDVQDVVMEGNASEAAVESTSDEPISDLKTILQQSDRRSNWKRKKAKEGSTSAPSGGKAIVGSGVEKILDSMPKKTESTQQSSALVVHKPTIHNPFPNAPGDGSSLGWIRSIAVKPGNNWFATGAGDRIIRIWDLASGRLKLSLMGHIGQVRGLAVSSRHPYLFSCGDDRMVKCWDLATNKVIRHYHGHLSGVYALALHPTLDVLVTSGRDATARVWDMHTKQAVHALSDHTGVVSSVKCQEADPQVITSSMDSIVRLWDLAAGKTMTTLTHHKKSVRAMTLHPTEFTFAITSSDNIKQWKYPEGQFMHNFEGPGVSLEEESPMPADNGAMGFWGWKSGYQFQRLDSLVQPGSPEGKAGISCVETGLHLITGKADKTIKVWKEDNQATPESPLLDWKPSLVRKRYQSNQYYDNLEQLLSRTQAKRLRDNIDIVQFEPLIKRQ
ncbi:pre-mRNA-splicing factor prp46 [Haplosporangium sp. Z 767]|nr:pre-mRNA-splicing factor prp46 [Haplosporangium sp. Z 767]KAF9186251.1 pre-mRNA-splicing factor prp46 [Haplosporangium sp. Z 11]